MNRQNDEQYVIQYVRQAMSSTTIAPPDTSRLNGLREPVESIYFAHQKGGPQAVQQAWPTVAKYAPQLAELMNVAPIWKSYSPTEFVQVRPPARYLDSDKIIQARELTAIVSQPGVGKSFWSLAKAADLADNNISTLIVAAEGMNPDRIIALEKYRATEGKPCLSEMLQIADRPLNLASDFEVDHFVQFAAQLQPKVIFIDTLAACNPGQDENTVQDMQPVMNRIREQIMDVLDCAVVLLHHTTKDGKGFRGSNAIRGSVTNMYILQEEDGLIILKSDKQRDAETDPDRYYRLVSFETRLHPDTREQLRSAVMLPADKTIRDPKVSLSKNQRKVLEVLDGFDNGMRYAALVDATGLAKSSLLAAVRQLIKAGFASQSEQGEPYFITEAGSKALANG